MPYLNRGAKSEFSGCGVPDFPSWFSTTFFKIVVEVTTSRMLQVSKLWFGVSKGILLAKYLAIKIHMTVNYCGRQLVRRLGWASPTKLHDWRLDVQVGTWKLGSLSGKREVCEDLRKRMIDVCCLQ